MRHTARRPLLDVHVQAAWRAQLAVAVHTPGLWPALVRRRHELFPHFAAYYTQLRALPRRVRRTLQRQWRLPLAGMALLLALGQQPGLAATIPVGGLCTLVDAITAANTDAATGGCPAGSGVDTIVLPAGSTQTLAEANNSTYGPTGLPVISSVVTIAGQGSDLTAPEQRRCTRTVHGPHASWPVCGRGNTIRRSGGPRADRGRPGGSGIIAVFGWHAHLLLP